MCIYINVEKTWKLLNWVISILCCVCNFILNLPIKWMFLFVCVLENMNTTLNWACSPIRILQSGWLPRQSNPILNYELTKKKIQFASCSRSFFIEWWSEENKNQTKKKKKKQKWKQKPINQTVHRKLKWCIFYERVQFAASEVKSVIEFSNLLKKKHSFVIFFGNKNG